MKYEQLKIAVKREKETRERWEQCWDDKHELTCTVEEERHLFHQYEEADAALAALLDF